MEQSLQWGERSPLALVAAAFFQLGAHSGSQSPVVPQVLHAGSGSEIAPSQKIKVVFQTEVSQ